MQNGKKLDILPSVLDGNEEAEIKLEDMPEEKRTELREQIRQKIGQSLGFYYEVHQEEWKAFLKAVSKNDE